MPDSRLRITRRQVSELESQADRQRALVAQLRAEGRPSEGACSLLKGIENLLSSYQADLARVEFEAGRQ
jgi:hypothetical protein